MFSLRLCVFASNSFRPIRGTFLRFCEAVFFLSQITRICTDIFFASLRAILSGRFVELSCVFVRQYFFSHRLHGFTQIFSLRLCEQFFQAELLELSCVFVRQYFFSHRLHGFTQMFSLRLCVFASNFFRPSRGLIKLFVFFSWQRISEKCLYCKAIYQSQEIFSMLPKALLPTPLSRLQALWLLCVGILCLFSQCHP